MSEIPPDGSIVDAVVPYSMEHDRPAMNVRGTLYLHHVAAFGGYTQYTVEGYQVDEKSIRAVECCLSAETRTFSPARLKNLRKRAGLTQVELAEQAGLTVTAVSKMERGLIKPLLSTAARLASVLDVKCEDLIGADEVNMPVSIYGEDSKGQQSHLDEAASIKDWKQFREWGDQLSMKDFCEVVHLCKNDFSKKPAALERQLKRAIENEEKELQLLAGDDPSALMKLLDVIREVRDTALKVLAAVRKRLPKSKTIHVFIGDAEEAEKRWRSRPRKAAAPEGKPTKGNTRKGTKMNTNRIDIGEPGEANGSLERSGKDTSALDSAVDKAYGDYLDRWAKEIQDHLDHGEKLKKQKRRRPER